MRVSLYCCVSVAGEIAFAHSLSLVMQIPKTLFVGQKVSANALPDPNGNLMSPAGFPNEQNWWSSDQLRFSIQFHFSLAIDVHMISSCWPEHDDGIFIRKFSS